MVNIIAFIKYYPLDASIMGLGFALIAYAAYMCHQGGLPIQQVKHYVIAGALLVIGLELVLLALLLYYGLGI